MMQEGKEKAEVMKIKWIDQVVADLCVAMPSHPRDENIRRISENWLGGLIVRIYAKSQSKMYTDLT